MTYKESSKCKRRTELRKNIEMRNYNKQNKPQIVTTRFNNKTWQENENYRMKHYPALGCAYGVPTKTNNNFASDEILLVLEMNNEENKIMGVGMIKNEVLYRNKCYNVYNNEEYNRYIYLGKHRIDRNEMNREEEEIMKVFEILCFTGKRHQKRLSGIKSFPVDMLYKMSKRAIELEKPDLVDFMTNMFKKRINNES